MQAQETCDYDDDHHTGTGPAADRISFLSHEMIRFLRLVVLHCCYVFLTCDPEPQAEAAVEEDSVCDLFRPSRHCLRMRTKKNTSSHNFCGIGGQLYDGHTCC